MNVSSILVYDKVFAVIEVTADSEAEAKALAEEKLSDEVFMMALDWQSAGEQFEINSIDSAEDSALKSA